MNLGIEQFRAVGASGLSLDRTVLIGKDGQLQRGCSLLAQRVMGWGNKLLNCFEKAGRVPPVPDHVAEKLRAALTTAMGERHADMALSTAKIHQGKPLTSRQVTHVLDLADQYRLNTVRKNESALTLHLAAEVDGTVKAALADEVRGHPDYGRVELSNDTLVSLREKASQRATETLRQRAHLQFPGLTGYLQKNVIGTSQGTPSASDSPDKAVTPGQAITVPWTELRRKALSPAEIKAIGCDKALTQERVAGLFRLLESGSELLAKTAWNQDGLKQLHTALHGHRRELESLINSISQAAIDAGEDSSPGTLTAATVMDLDTQKRLVEAKIDTVEMMARNDPLSRHARLASNKQWVAVGLRVVETAHRTLAEEVRGARAEKEAGMAKNPAKTDQLIKEGLATQSELEALKKSWLGRLTNLETRARNMDLFTDQVRAPSGKADTTHPIVADKAKILGDLRKELLAVGLKEELVENCLSKKVLSAVHNELQAALGNWTPESKSMVFTRDGVSRQYVSTTTPASAIDKRFAAKYADGMVGAGTTDGQGGVRNLKISELVDGQGQRVAHIVGHGVLDMWDITDQAARRDANAAGARQVLDAAVTGNAGLMARLRQAAQTTEGGDELAPPPRLTHVSVGLISPDSIRSLPLLRRLNPKFDELTFTRNQFAAFDDAAKAGQVGIVDPEQPGQELKVRLDINAITFSFGINKIATSPLLGQISGVWRNVNEHNTRNMIKLIGDLGPAGSRGADLRGTAPGGFIGQVIEAVSAKLSTPDGTLDLPRQEALRDMVGRLHLQTEVVRNMFLEREFERADGDSAKMGREIVFLQTLADRALQQAGVDTMAATVSKGCKSDKDRGGVLDVEVKTKMVLQDLGSDLRYDRPMDDQDRSIYNQMSAQSGQLENQTRNAGLPGSKETPHMKDRIGDLQVMQYLAGLGAFASA
ncbi:inositol phosphate phosphatase SopB [Achromobacter marplatensis]|uniref:inositol phosphate phosphatase SopB n=1 Tax=Achromobacter marplatensis TaxID=470868 RepID=UPI0039F66356